MARSTPSNPNLDAVTPAHCHCGRCTRFHHVVGWQSDCAGGALLLANTACGSTLSVAHVECASVCANQACGRIIRAGEVKSCGVDQDGNNVVLCASCRDQRLVGMPFLIMPAGQREAR